MSEEIIIAYNWLATFKGNHVLDVVFMPAVNRVLVYNEYYADQHSIKVSESLYVILHGFFSEERELDESLQYVNNLCRKFALDEIIAEL